MHDGRWFGGVAPDAEFFSGTTRRGGGRAVVSEQREGGEYNQNKCKKTRVHAGACEGFWFVHIQSAGSILAILDLVVPPGRAMEILVHFMAKQSLRDRRVHGNFSGGRIGFFGADQRST